jgi:DNA-binding CsgD family transcriptional regulator
MTSLGTTLLTALQALRALGVETQGLLDGTGVDERTLQAGDVHLPWDAMVRVLDRLEPRLPAHQHGPLAAEWLGRHPTFRAAAIFTRGPASWLELFWRLAGLTHPAVEYRLEAAPAGPRLTARLKSGARPCRLWFELMHQWAVHAPSLLKASPLAVRSVEVSSTSLAARYEPPEPTSTLERQSRATRLPLRTIFGSLRTLDRARLRRFQDGHQLAGPGVERTTGSREHFAARFSLTTREHQVLALLADGLLPAEIARELSMSVATARVHLKRIYSKTETRGQRALLARLEAEALQ